MWWTYRSIAKHLLAPLAKEEVTLFAHFNRPGVIDNPRSGENGVAVNSATPRGLRFDFCWNEDQDEARIDADLRVLTRFPFRDEADATAGTRRALMFQLHSLRRLRQMIDLAGWERYDAYLLIRPDLEYLDPIDVRRDLEPILAGAADIVTPSWHSWGGLNDRFCFASAAGARAFLDRGALAEAFGREKGYIHSEELLAFAADAAGLRVAHTPLRARRIRGNGRIEFENFDHSRAHYWKTRASMWLHRKVGGIG